MGDTLGTTPSDKQPPNAPVVKEFLFFTTTFSSPILLACTYFVLWQLPRG